MLEFFQAIVATNTPKMGFKDLLQLLTTPVYTPSETTQPPTSQFAVHRQVCNPMAVCKLKSIAELGKIFWLSL